MAIQFQCDRCGRWLKANEVKAGKEIECPDCANVMQIPIPENVIDATVKHASSVRDDENPFRSPDDQQSHTDLTGRRFSIAGPGRRFLGAFLDNISMIVFILPGLVLMGVARGFNEDEDLGDPLIAVLGLGLFLVGLIAWVGISVYLYAVRSQSIAKYLLRMQILDYDTNQPASFVSCAVIRGFVNGILCALPCVGAIYSLVDSVYIFSEDHRCLHDHLANTYVVNLPEDSDGIYDTPDIRQSSYQGDSYL